VTIGGGGSQRSRMAEPQVTKKGHGGDACGARNPRAHSGACVVPDQGDQLQGSW
jgi:hypothetical protein